MRKILYRAATVTMLGAVLLGGVVATAPAAPAVGKSSCTRHIQRSAALSDITGSNVHLRTGPGARYASRGLLVEGTGLLRKCTKGRWTYVKIVSDAHKDRHGWVASRFIR